MSLNWKGNLLVGAILMVCFAVPRFLDTFAWAEVFLGTVFFLGANYLNNKFDDINQYDE